MTKSTSCKCLNSLTLKIIAMVLMLCDHMWATVISGNQWMTNIGRLAFPIFAFQAAEGFLHTKNFKKYLTRMFLFALITEIPFNLMFSGGMFFPFHQNVLFTFCIALLFLRLSEKARAKGTLIYILSAAGCCLAGALVGTVTMVDYGGLGVLTVFLFYFCHGKRFGWIGELAGMIFLHGILTSGLVLNLTLFGIPLDISQQSLAVLALIPIWLYNGKQGPHSRSIQYACYAFYPIHMLILFLISELMFHSF